MKTRFLLAFPLIPLTLAAGCGSGNSSNSIALPTTDSALSRSATDGGLTATLTEDKDAVVAGGTVTFTLSLTNHSTTPITYLASVGCPNAYQVINGLSSSIAVTNTSNATQSSLPYVGVNCNAIGLPVSATLAPGASVTGTVSSGKIFATAGKYSVSASVADLTSADSSTAPPLTPGPLTVTVQ
jgi:hypothetical protein